MYADGEQVGYSDEWEEATNTTLPPGTSLVAFELKGSLAALLLASLDNTWSTGDPGLKCTDDVSVNVTNDWKHYSVYHCFVL